MKYSKSFFTNFKLEFQLSNFKIIRVEDFFKNQEVDVFHKNYKIDYYTIFLVTEDIGRHTINYEDFYYTKGTILAIRKDQTHRFYPNKKTKGFLLFFKEDFLNEFLNEKEISATLQMFNELLVSPKTQLKQKEFATILQVIKSIAYEYADISDSYSLTIIRSYLHVLITQIHRIKSDGYNKVQLSNYLKQFIRFQNLLEKNYMVSKKVDFYAKKLGYSSKKLNSIINYITDKSVKTFIDDVVIIKAKRDLLHLNISIKEIAYKLGFKDPTNFFKYFKKHTGFTPESFRNRYKV